jgi:hypothetical protein
MPIYASKGKISIVINEDKLKNEVFFKDSGIGIPEMN